MKKRTLLSLYLSLLILATFGCSSKTKEIIENSAAGTIHVSQDSAVKIQTPGERPEDDEVKPESQAQETYKILLKQGDNGAEVTELQKNLYNINYDIVVDGFYGKQTAEVIKRLQSSNNIEPTGNLDEKTNAIIKSIKPVRTYSAKIKEVPLVSSKPAENKPKGLTTIPDIKTSPGNAEQVIVVLASAYGTSRASFITYEKVNGYWQVVLSGSAVTGKKGFSDNRSEGDMTSPTGKYSIPFLFGIADNPGVRLPYRKVREGDYWVSNKIIEEYNVWMYYDGDNAKERFYNYEALWTIPLYKYVAVIDFNYGPGRVLGKGSAIFLHIAPPNGGSTAGCIAVSESNLVKILRWLDPARKPTIIMGVKGHI